MTVTVYRWQDMEGRGPYRAPLSMYWKDSDHEARNPAMQDEFGWELFERRDPKEHMGCAFRSPEQMQRWFTPAERKCMATLGYEFVQMEVDRIVAESERQLVFARRKPLRIGTQRVRIEEPA